MAKTYKDSSGEFCPLVTVDKNHGRWEAKDCTAECEEDVNKIIESVIPERRCCGESDTDRIIEAMVRHGFDKASGGNYFDSSNRDPAPTHAMIFDHTATSTAMRSK